MLDLMVPELSYMFGFFQADGHLSEDSRNRGRFRLELGLRDRFILEKFQGLLEHYSSIRERTRDTNYKEDYHAAVLSIYDLKLRQELIELGLPPGKKSAIVSLPNSQFIEMDYFRGWIDANGSVGLTKQAFPFVSLTVYSENIAQAYLTFLNKTIGVVKLNHRNARDNIYNILVYKEDAISLIKILYYPNALCLPRKHTKAQEVLQWVRPINMKKRLQTKKWTKEQDAYITQHSIEDSMAMFDRSKKSIEIRLWRLKRSDDNVIL